MCGMSECGMSGCGMSGVPPPCPAPPLAPSLTCSRGEGQGHGSAEPVSGTERLRWAGDAPACPLYSGMSRRSRVSPPTRAARGPVSQSARSGVTAWQGSVPCTDGTHCPRQPAGPGWNGSPGLGGGVLQTVSQPSRGQSRGGSGPPQSAWPGPPTAVRGVRVGERKIAYVRGNGLYKRKGVGKMRSRREAWWDDIHLLAISSNHTVKIRPAFPAPLQVMRGETAEDVIAGDCMFGGANIPRDGWSHEAKYSGSSTAKDLD